MNELEIADIRKKAENDEPILSIDILRLINYYENEKVMSRVITGEWVKQRITLERYARGEL